MKTKIDPSRWKWCIMCDSPYIECNHCGIISCSGGGCDMCHDEFELANKMIDDGTIPPLHTIPGWITREADEAAMRDGYNANGLNPWRDSDCWEDKERSERMQRIARENPPKQVKRD